MATVGAARSGGAGASTGAGTGTTEGSRAALAATSSRRATRIRGSGLGSSSSVGVSLQTAGVSSMVAALGRAGLVAVIAVGSPSLAARERGKGDRSDGASAGSSRAGSPGVGVGDGCRASAQTGSAEVST